MKKICYVVTESITIKAFFVNQLQFLADNGFDVYVICSPDKILGNILGDSIHYIPVKISRGVATFSLLKTIFELKAIFEKEKFDIVQYSTPNAAFCASIAAKLAGVRIRNYHLMGLRYYASGGFVRSILKFIEKVSCDCSTHIECVSKSNLDLGLKENLYSKEKVTVVWNGSTGGVDAEKFDISKREVWRSEIRGELGWKDDFIFGFVGRITKDKGLNEIFKAFKHLKSGAKLIVIGPNEGSETLDDNLLNFAKSNENIVFMQERDDIEKIYAAIDMLLLPSYREGFGMVIAEAAQMGTPAIVSNIPGPIDVVQKDQTAFLVEVGNSDELYSKMKYALLHRDVVDEMSENCNRFISDNFDSKKLDKYILKRKEYLLNLQ